MSRGVWIRFFLVLGLLVGCVALAVNVLGAVLIVRFASRLYERTLMRTERKIGFGEALKLSD